MANRIKNVLSIKKLSFGYGFTDVFSDISFDIAKGDYVALAGPNGAGKTTLVNLALGLLSAREGSISLFGSSPEKFRGWGKIGYLSQRANPNPLFPATVKEVIGTGLLSTKKFPRRLGPADDQKINQVLNQMGISDLRDSLVGNLSGGQTQKVFLARALVSEPEFLIMDEPSSALDPQTRERFFELIEKLNKEKGVTILIITHDVSQVGKYADKLLYLDKRVVFYGPFSDFCHSEEMEEYFGHFAQHMICHQHD
jgi:zinc transport system ATP-binding protein